MVVSFLGFRPIGDSMTREKKRKLKGSNVSVSNNNTIKRFNDSGKEEKTATSMFFFQKPLPPEEFQ